MDSSLQFNSFADAHVITRSASLHPAKNKMKNSVIRVKIVEIFIHTPNAPITGRNEVVCVVLIKHISELRSVGPSNAKHCGRRLVCYE